MDLYIMSVKETECISENYIKENFQKRMDYAKRFVHKEDRLRCIGAGALISGILGIKEERLLYSEYGKPFASEFSTKFNISHSGDYVVLAADSEEVGVDIEIIDSSHLDMAEEVFLPEELDWMKSDSTSRFFVLWTLKESVMKQCGLGFSLLPKNFSVIPLLNGEYLMLDGKRIYAATCFFDGHCISISSTHKIKSIEPVIITAKDIK